MGEEREEEQERGEVEKGVAQDISRERCIC